MGHPALESAGLLLLGAEDEIVDARLVDVEGPQVVVAEIFGDLSRNFRLERFEGLEASTKGPLGEPVLIGRASWASQYSLGVGRASTHWALGEPVLRGWASQLSQPPQQRLLSYGASARARSALCLLGAFS